jgi:hypothetical protein
MGTHMKTTVDIAPVLLDDAKRVARDRGITLRALIEEGLHLVLSDANAGEPYRYEPVTIELKAPDGVDLGDPRVLKELFRYRSRPI